MSGTTSGKKGGRKTHRKGAHKSAKPAGEIRQSQLLTTYGPGALVDLVDDAVIIGGLEYWSYNYAGANKGALIIDDTRLRDALAQRLESEWKGGRYLAVDEAFKAPPAGDQRDARQDVGIRVFEFPRWFVCQNPKCRALQGARGLERKGGKYRHRCDVSTGGKAEWDCVPVRFVGACKNGHVEDFPWKEWVHANEEDPTPCVGSRLKLWEGDSGDISEVSVECVTCRTKRKVTEAMVEHNNPFCQGHRPWLGHEAREECSEKIRLLTRTASNAYFAQVESSLSIPEADNDMRELVQSNWSILENADAETLPVLRKTIQALKVFGSIDDDSILEVIKSVRNKEAAEENLRVAEYKTFLAAVDEPPGDIPEKGSRFHAVKLKDPKLSPGVDRIVIAKRLREVRVQVGFTRLEPPTASLQGEFDLGTRRAELGMNTDWLPASEINGEGLFVALDEKAVVEWENRPAVKEREAELQAGFEAWAEQMYGEGSKKEQPPPPFPGARFYLVHSLAHMLITELALDCGYPASAIRERLYCAPYDAEQPMAGFLLLTGTSGADGTLGGLVEEGRRLDQHIRRALQQNGLCSNDPVCADHSPKQDLAERYLEGAACHGCLFVAECSCERFNKYLDRALVVPTIGRDATAFFKADD